MKRTLIAAAAGLTAVVAQDPAQGWLGYAVGNFPAGNMVTFIEAYWKVGANPRPSGSFFSPWFGMDPPDNLNLLQPVNPWLGDGWQIYNEYFQWSPEKNVNSASHNVNAGDLLYGSITYVPAAGGKEPSYNIYHKSLADGWDVTTNIPIQKAHNGMYKNFSIVYFVYEKTAPCGDYPPDGEVVFTNITIQYDGKNVTDQVQWKTAYVDDVCDNRATVVDPQTIKITWNTKAADPSPELIAASQSGKTGMRRPVRAAAPVQPLAGAPAQAKTADVQ